MRITLLLALLALPIFAQSDAPLRALNIEFGIKDSEATQWDGSLSMSRGEVVELRGHHFTADASLGAGNSWTASTTEWVGHGGGMHPHELPFSHSTRVMTIGVTLYYRSPEDAEVNVKTAQGDFSFRLGDVPVSGPLPLLGTRVEVFRVPPVEPVSTERYEDDYPSILAGEDDTLSVAWIGYRENADRVFFRQRTGGDWSDIEEVSERAGDLYGTAMATDGDGRTWVVWSERDGQNWKLQSRSFDGDSWSGVETIPAGAGTNLFHRLASDTKGRLHLTWQSARRGRADIYYAMRSGNSWSKELLLSDPKKDERANDWSPAIATDSKGTAWVAWDTYDGGSYNIRLRPVRNGRAGSLMRVTDTPRFHAHASLAIDDRDRVWIAYDLAEANWAKDNGFLLTGGAGIYQSRKIRFAVWDGSQWLEPRDDLAAQVRHTVQRYVHSPRIIFDADGRLWTFFRPRTSSTRPESLWAAGGKWEVYASYYAGDRWSKTFAVPESVGRNEGPLAVAANSSGVQLAWITDQRLWGGPNFGHLPGDNQVFIANATAHLKTAAPPAPLLGRRGAEPPAQLATEPREKDQVAALRAYSIESEGKTYRIYRGDLHRHTDISTDGSGDGSLFASYRYMMDAAAMDFYLVADHNSGYDQEYSWWRIEKSEDMFHVPGFFVTLFGYERSMGYPNGHRNVIFAKRGTRTLPSTAEERKTSTGPRLYPYLRQNNGIATSHTSHTSMGTDWRDNDPELEPIVEIFQGARTSAEHEGAPLSPSAQRTDLWAGNYRPLGFVWNAWAKGYKLGVQASSDHVSTHTSYAMALAEDYSREGLLDAMRRRHTYGATTNMILDFRLRDGSVEHIQGDDYASDSIPELIVKTVGTAPIKEIAIVRDNTYIHKRPGSGNQADFTFREPTLDPGQHYYYVRVEQEDNHVAWSSPIWVKYQ